MAVWMGRLPPGLVAKVNFFVDLILLLVALHVSTILSETGSGGYSGLIWFAAGASAVWIVASTALRHYDPWAEHEPGDDAAMVTVLVMSVATVLGLVNVFAPNIVALPKIGYFLVAFWPATLLLRLLVFRLLSKREAPLDEVLIIGTGALGRCTAEDPQRRARHRVVGYLHFPGESRHGIRGEVLGESTDLEAKLKTIPVSEIYIAGNMLKQAEAMQACVGICERFGVPFAIPACNFRLRLARPINGHAVSDGYIHYSSVDPKPHQMALKRLFDIVCSGVALWVTLPLLPLMALLIKLTSRGPVLFRQPRIGLHGRPFNILKFRSMVANAEQLQESLRKHNEQSGPVFKIKRDPRITPIGRFMRKYSIDELPQLINVLRGDMSIVGPRPPVPTEVAKYEAWQRRRLSVRPGITCIWQVSGRNEISFEQWMYLDLQYIDHWSLAQDVSLVFKTFPVVLTGRGAS